MNDPTRRQQVMTRVVPFRIPAPADPSDPASVTDFVLEQFGNALKRGRRLPPDPLSLALLQALDGVRGITQVRRHHTAWQTRLRTGRDWIEYRWPSAGQIVLVLKELRSIWQVADAVQHDQSAGAVLTYVGAGEALRPLSCPQRCSGPCHDERHQTNTVPYKLDAWQPCALLFNRNPDAPNDPHWIGRLYLLTAAMQIERSWRAVKRTVQDDPRFGDVALAELRAATQEEER